MLKSLDVSLVTDSRSPPDTLANVEDDVAEVLDSGSTTGSDLVSGKTGVNEDSLR